MKQYQFSLKDECMNELIDYSKSNYQKKKSNLKSIPVSKQFLNQFEDGKVYNEDDFEIKQEQKLSYGENIKSGGFENGSQIYFEMVAIPKQKVDGTDNNEIVLDLLWFVFTENENKEEISIKKSDFQKYIREIQNSFTITRK